MLKAEILENLRKITLEEEILKVQVNISRILRATPKITLELSE